MPVIEGRNPFHLGTEFLVRLLPNLIQKNKLQVLGQTLNSSADVQIEQIHDMLIKTMFVHASNDSSLPMINDYLALQDQGWSLMIFEDDPEVASSIPVEVVNHVDSIESVFSTRFDPTSHSHAIMHGYIEPPVEGNYNFYIEALDNSPPVSFKVLLDGELIIEAGATQNTQIINLIPGKLYELKVIAKGIESEFSIDWESIGFARNPISTSSIYPAHSFDKFEASYLRLLKIISVIQNFKLSTDEFNYVAKNKEFQLSDDQSWLNLVPNQILERGQSIDIDQTISKLVNNFIGISKYLALKSLLNITDDQLIFLLEDVDSKDEKDQPLLNKITSWREQDLASILNHFGLTRDDKTSVGHLAHINNFHRVSHAFEMLQKLKVSAESLIDSITNYPDATQLKTLQNALRARYDLTDWYRLIQPINDDLRNLQRDALIAFVLNQFRSNSELANINTADKLYEHFLIDVQMDACMKTSRIKQAISSIQLFVQRCLLNLEIGDGTDETQGVYPESIIGNHWYWMKNYRVWEANRKIFLYPENWLEPELRDNKSPAFRDLESELLQSDITEDSAARAYGHYLEKLEEVSKLEICGMYYEQHKLTELSDDVVHVIARTAGARRTYYYRRQDGGTSWSPWEKIDVNIEDNPVLPVVWKGRLFLFWVSILQEGMEPSPVDGPNPNRAASNRSPGELRQVAGQPRVKVTATLYYSEYLNNKWQPPKTSNLNSPVSLGNFEVNTFKRSAIHLKAVVTQELLIRLDYDGRNQSKFFHLHNTHSLPDDNPSSGKYEYSLAAINNQFLQRSFQSNLNIEYYMFGAGEFSGRRDHSQYIDVLSLRGEADIIEPKHVEVNNLLFPFFYQDAKHLFYVTMLEVEKPFVFNSDIDIGVVNNFDISTIKFDKLIELPKYEIFELDKHAVYQLGPIVGDLINPGWQESNIGEVNQNISIHWDSTSNVQFGDRKVYSDTSIRTNSKLNF